MADSHAVLIAEIATLRAALAEARRWKFCPECGSSNSERCSDFAMTHRECMDCGQEWHTDIDYSDVVAKNLRKREEAERALAEARIQLEILATKMTKHRELTGPEVEMLPVFLARVLLTPGTIIREYETCYPWLLAGEIMGLSVLLPAKKSQEKP